VFLKLKNARFCFAILLVCLINLLGNSNIFAMDVSTKSGGRFQYSSTTSIESTVGDAILRASNMPTKENYLMVVDVAGRAAKHFAELGDFANSVNYRVMAAKANVSAFPTNEDLREEAIAVLIEAAEIWKSVDEVIAEGYLEQIEYDELSFDELSLALDKLSLDGSSK